jgi:hypothetical protein
LTPTTAAAIALTPSPTNRVMTTEVLHSNTGKSITVWDDRASAETCNTKTYPVVLKKLNAVLVGTPRFETYESILELVH